MALTTFGSKYRSLMPSGDYVVVGDEGSGTFKPHIKLNKWGTECTVGLAFPTARTNNPTLSSGKLAWNGGANIGINFYDKPADKQNDLGSFEFEIILKKKPVTNKVSLTLESQGLTFHYQPPLTPEEIAQGRIRPDNVTGSYAVYHATRSPMHRSQADADKYRAGKAFHIYRPKLTDALGNTTWADLNITGTTLTIVVPQVFLDMATYPVTIDPNFGYTTVAGSWDQYFDSATECFVAELGAAPEAGTLNYLWWCLYNDEGSRTVKSAFYGTTTGKPSTRLAIDTNAFTVTDTSAPGTFVKSTDDYNLAITSGSVYWAAVGVGQGTALFSVGYDAVAGYEGYFDNVVTPPATWTDYTYGPHTDRRFSVYAAYTAAGGQVESGAAAMIALGLFTAVPRWKRGGAFAVTGAGTLAAAGGRRRLASAIATGLGLLTGAGSRLTKGVLAITGAGLLASIGRRNRFGATAVTGIGNLTSAGRRTVTGAMAAVGVGAVSVVGTIIEAVGELFGAAAMVAQGLITFVGGRARGAASAIIGQGLLTGASGIQRGAALAITGIGDLTATGLRGVLGSMAVVGQGLLTGASGVARGAASTLTGIGNLIAAGSTVSGIIIEWGASVITGIGALTISGRRAVSGATSIVGVGLLTTAGSIFEALKVIALTVSLYARTLISKLYARTGIPKFFSRAIAIEHGEQAATLFPWVFPIVFTGTMPETVKAKNRSITLKMKVK